MLFLKTDFSADTTELTGSQREDCLVSISILAFQIDRCCISSMFPYVCQTVKTCQSFHDTIGYSFEWTENVARKSPENKNMKTSQGMFWFWASFSVLGHRIAMNSKFRGGGR